MKAQGQPPYSNNNNNNNNVGSSSSEEENEEIIIDVPPQDPLHDRLRELHKKVQAFDSSPSVNPFSHPHLQQSENVGSIKSMLERTPEKKVNQFIANQTRSLRDIKKKKSANRVKDMDAGYKVKTADKWELECNTLNTVLTFFKHIECVKEVPDISPNPATKYCTLADYQAVIREELHTIRDNSQGGFMKNNSNYFKWKNSKLQNFTINLDKGLTALKADIASDHAKGRFNNP